MRKMILLAAFALTMGVSATAFAATITNLSGQSCGDSTGTWHFVNVQTNGAAAGTLTATWDSGDSCTKTADTVNKREQGFYCTASGTLTSASSNLPGYIRLSDFSCDSKGEPPKK